MNLGFLNLKTFSWAEDGPVKIRALYIKPEAPSVGLKVEPEK